MAQRVIEPPMLAMSGTLRSETVTMRNAPADGGLTATVVPAGTPVEVQHVVVREEVLTFLTDEEIEQLPEAEREKAREGVLMWEETGRSDGRTPLAVGRGATVVVTVGLRSQPLPDIISATLVIGGMAMERVELPVVVVPDTGRAAIASQPSSLRLAAEPGEVVGQGSSSNQSGWIRVAGGPPATVVAVLASGSSIVRIKHVIRMTTVHKMFTEEELEGFPEAEREEKRRNGYDTLEEAARVGGGTPLPVGGGDELQVFLEIAPPLTAGLDVTTDVLVLVATTWQRIEVPIHVVTGKVTAVLSSGTVSVAQGQESTSAEVVLTSVAGPATDVLLTPAAHADSFSVTPTLLHLGRGETVTTPLRILVASDVFVGTYAVGLQVQYFEGLAARQLPLTVTLLSGTLTVTALQPFLSARQGGSVTSSVQLVVSGGFKRVTFQAGPLPPGVSMERQVWEGSGPATATVPLELRVEPAARLVTLAPFTVSWSASDGIHAGVLNLRLTVLLQPESRSFSQPVITPAGTALGGRAEMELHNDGTGRFRGHMRATGLPSYKFRVRGVVRSADGTIAAMAQKSGEVFGADTPGERQLSWDDAIPSDLVADRWAEIRTASMVVSKSYEMSGVLGGLTDAVVDLLEFVAGAALLDAVVPGGSALLGLVLVGSELGDLAGVRVVGPGGLVGFVAAGGAACLLGPAVVIPVFVGGVLAGNAEVEHRAMNAEEQAFANRVFGDTLPYDRILLTNLTGAGDRPFVVPNVDGSILVNLGENCFENPMTHQDESYGEEGQLTIHELTHAWQIANSGLTSDYFWRAALDKLGVGMGYSYGPPGLPWSDFGLEGQASLVDEWFAGTTDHEVGWFPAGADRLHLNEHDPYYGYIAEHILMGQP